MGVSQITGTIMEVPIKRIIVLRCPYLGSPYFSELPCSLSYMRRNRTTSEGFKSANVSGLWSLAGLLLVLKHGVHEERLESSMSRIPLLPVFMVVTMTIGIRICVAIV